VLLNVSFERRLSSRPGTLLCKCTSQGVARVAWGLSNFQEPEPPDSSRSTPSSFTPVFSEGQSSELEPEFKLHRERKEGKSFQTGNCRGEDFWNSSLWETSKGRVMLWKLTVRMGKPCRMPDLGNWHSRPLLVEMSQSAHVEALYRPRHQTLGTMLQISD
jgi:hypothetical protein